jgi:predicted DNA-binding transcriptional regulator YafY
MNRLDRLTAILIQLQSKRIVKAQDIAERFSISLRTVYRDVRTLEQAGVPLSGETGVGYSIMDGYRLPPVMFTIDEATAFLTAEKLVEKLTDTPTEESYKSAMFKVKAVLRSAEKDLLENMDQSIEVVRNPYLPHIKPGPLQSILRGISEKKILTIDYFANHSQEKTKRNIDPVGIFYSGNKWHLIAWCHLRNDYRNFRVDRIHGIVPTGTSITKVHPSLQSFLKKISKEEQLHPVVMRVDKSILKYFGDQKYYNGFVSEKEVNGKVEMTFLCASLESFTRWFMMFGDNAEIMSPDSLKKMIKALATVISKK